MYLHKIYILSLLGIIIWNFCIFLQSTVKLLSFAVFEHCSRKILGIDLIIIGIAYHIIEYQITFQYGIICACRHSSVRKCSKPSSCLNRGKRYTISVRASIIQNFFFCFAVFFKGCCNYAVFCLISFSESIIFFCNFRTQLNKFSIFRYYRIFIRLPRIWSWRWRRRHWCWCLRSLCWRWCRRYGSGLCRSWFCRSLCWRWRCRRRWC